MRNEGHAHVSPRCTFCKACPASILASGRARAEWQGRSAGSGSCVGWQVRRHRLRGSQAHLLWRPSACSDQQAERKKRCKHAAAACRPSAAHPQYRPRVCTTRKSRFGFQECLKTRSWVQSQPGVSLSTTLKAAWLWRALWAASKGSAVKLRTPSRHSRARQRSLTRLPGGQPRWRPGEAACRGLRRVVAACIHAGAGRSLWKATATLVV